MATLWEYFTKDLANAVSVDFTWQTRDANPQDIPGKVRVHDLWPTTFRSTPPIRKFALL